MTEEAQQIALVTGGAGASVRGSVVNWPGPATTW